MLGLNPSCLGSADATSPSLGAGFVPCSCVMWLGRTGPQVTAARFGCQHSNAVLPGAAPRNPAGTAQGAGGRRGVGFAFAKPIRGPGDWVGEQSVGFRLSG